MSWRHGFAGETVSTDRNFLSGCMVSLAKLCDLSRFPIGKFQQNNLPHYPFHSQIKEYLDLGIQVNYLAFPRTGTDSESFNKIVSAWCSSNPNKSITELKLGYKIEENICDNNPVQEHFNLGNSLGVSGTPSIITSEGRMIPGYVPPEELVGLLES